MSGFGDYHCNCNIIQKKDLIGRVIAMGLGDVILESHCWGEGSEKERKTGVTLPCGSQLVCWNGCNVCAFPSKGSRDKLKRSLLGVDLSQ